MARWLVLVALAAGCGDNATPDGLMRSGSRLRLVAYELADGTRTIDDHVFYDRERREDCTVEPFSSGERHCMPVTAGGETLFTEGTCHRLVGAAPATEPPPRYFIRRFLLNGESLPSRLYVAGEPVAAPALTWKQQDAECLGPYPIEPGVDYYAVGDEIGADELVTIRAAETRHGERLAIAIDETDDGWRMPGAYTDELLHEVCALAPATNDTLARCVPSKLPAIDYYADSACSQPLLDAPLMVHTELASGCSEIVMPGAPSSAGIVYEVLGEACRPAAAPSRTLYARADGLDVATLARDHGAGDRLALMVDHAPATLVPDGLVFDTELGAECAIGSSGDGLACVPAGSLAVRPFFSDDACATLVDIVFVPVGACQRPQRFAGGRPIDPAVYPAPIYELTTGDRCAAYAPPPRFEIHAVGAPATDLVSATRVID